MRCYNLFNRNSCGYWRFRTRSLDFVISFKMVDENSRDFATLPVLLHFCYKLKAILARYLHTPKKFSNTWPDWKMRNSHLSEWSQHRKYCKYALFIWNNVYSTHARYIHTYMSPYFDESQKTLTYVVQTPIWENKTVCVSHSSFLWFPWCVLNLIVFYFYFFGNRAWKKTWIVSHQNDVPWPSWRPKITGISPVCLIFVLSHIKENIKAPRYWQEASPHREPISQKTFLCGDVIMQAWSWTEFVEWDIAFYV